MSYIGKIPATGNFVKLDAISVVNGQAAYTMQSGSVNFTPESANHMLVSLNGVIQAPVSSFTVSGSTITFASNLVTGDVIDFIMVYGNVLDIGTPSDNTVTASKLTTDSVQTAKIVDDAVTKAKVNFISDGTAGVEVKGDGGSNDGYIQLNCSQNSHGVKIKSPPHSAGQSYTLTLPQSITNDYYLKTDGSGNLSFAQVSSDYVKISEAHNDSSATTVDFTLDTATYDHFQLYWWSRPASDGYSLRARWMVDSTEQTGSDYNHGHFGTTSTNSYYSNVGENADHFRIINNAGNESNQGHHFYATITPRKSNDLSNLKAGNVITWFAIRTDSSHNFRPIYGCAWYNGTSYEPNKIRLYMESGDFQAYSYRLYGIK